MRYHLHVLEWLSTKRQEMKIVGMGMERGTHVKWCSYYGNSMEVSKKIPKKQNLMCDLAIPLLVQIQRKMKSLH